MCKMWQNICANIVIAFGVIGLIIGMAEPSTPNHYQDGMLAIILGMQFSNWTKS